MRPAAIAFQQGQMCIRDRELLLRDIEQAGQEANCAVLMAKIKSCLSTTQFRRLWMHYAEGKSVTEIAAIEGVSKAGISLADVYKRQNIGTGCADFIWICQLRQCNLKALDIRHILSTGSLECTVKGYNNVNNDIAHIIIG